MDTNSYYYAKQYASILNSSSNNHQSTSTGFCLSNVGLLFMCLCLFCSFMLAITFNNVLGYFCFFVVSNICTIIHYACIVYHYSLLCTHIHMSTHIVCIVDVPYTNIVYTRTRLLHLLDTHTSTCPLPKANIQLNTPRAHRYVSSIALCRSVVMVSGAVA